MFNKDIQLKIISIGVKKWQVAELIGIADTTFSKWLRREMPEEKRVQVLAAIKKLAKEGA